MEIGYAGVDWLTMTSKESAVGQKWYDIYRKYKAVRMGEGNREKPFHNGFYGGLKIGQMTVGYSDAIGYICIVSGGDAERMFQRLMPGKKRVTRLDLCFDFLYPYPVDLVKSIFRKLASKGKNNQRKFKSVINSDGGKTLYLGSRQSLQFGRLYDKGVESMKYPPGRLWRAEVEYKKPLSGNIAEKLAQVNSEDRGLAICDTVSEWFADRKALLFPLSGMPNAMHVSVEQRITTAEKKLAWLKTQVSPSISDLIAAGHGKEVLSVLGFDVETISRCLVSDA